MNEVGNILRVLCTKKRRSKKLGATTNALQKQFGFEFGDELSRYCDRLRTHQLDGDREYHARKHFRPALLSLSETIRVHDDLASCYLEGFFSAATPFASLYHDIVYLVGWAQSSKGHHEVVEWHWDEGYAYAGEPSLTAFLHRAAEREDLVLPPSAARKTRVVKHLDTRALWERSRWLTHVFLRTHYRENWAFFQTAAPRRQYTSERKHVAEWAHLAAHWIWWSFFFEDDERLDDVLALSKGHRHPFVVESRALVTDFQRGKTEPLGKLVDVAATREEIYEHASHLMTATARRALAKSLAVQAATTRERGEALARSGDDVLTELRALLEADDLDFARLRGFDYLRARDAEELGDALHIPEYFELLQVSPDTYDRFAHLRTNVTAAHHAALLAALKDDLRTKKPKGSTGVLVDLIGHASGNYEQMLGVLNGLGKRALTRIDPEITYACRLFPSSKPARTRMTNSAAEFTASIHRKKRESPSGYDALYQLDRLETARALNRFIIECETYTFGSWPWIKVIAAMKRARALKHGKRCLPGLEAVVGASYHDYGREQAMVSLLRLGPERAKRDWLEGEWGDWKNVPAKRAAFTAGRLWLTPRTQSVRADAKSLIRRFRKETKGVRMETVAGMHGLVMAIEAKGIRSLHPNLKPILKWRITPDRYEMRPELVKIELALLKLRTARLLG